VPFLLLPQIALAQSTPASAPASAEGNAPVQLTPFLVSTEGDDGYRAANTLSGTRMNASLFHTPAAISVLTKEFLDDIGAENVADMLKLNRRSAPGIGGTIVNRGMAKPGGGALEKVKRG
jgi:outer membrane receptor for ferric coprogen and ferric-rhodotorulic acid